MPPTPFADEKSVKCTYGHTHYVAQQTDNNTCGAYAMRAALMEIDPNGDWADPETMYGFMGISKGGWQGKTLKSYVSIFADAYELVDHKGHIGAAARDNDVDTLPMIVSARGHMTGSKDPAAGHWMVLSKRHRNTVMCDKFCILDSASGACHAVPVPKSDGTASFQFQDSKQNQWRIEFDIGCYVFKPKKKP
jgi:hypothetical protein